MLDELEPRRLLSVTITTNNRTIRIACDDNGDSVAFALYKKNQAQLYVAGVLTQTFTLSAYTGVSFAGGSGDDSLIMGHVGLKVYASGGDGRDVLSACSTAATNDTLLGGAANDYIYGGPGNDFIDGGGGDDGLFGDAGDDTFKILSDSNGDDTVTGGDGYDTIDCSNYNRGVHLRLGDRTPSVLAVDDFVYEDVERVFATGYADNIANVSGRPLTVYLGLGNDIYTGGRGNETIFGGRGNDKIATYGGNDLIVDQDGTNNINGGSGDDTAVIAAGTAGTTTQVEHSETDLSKLSFTGGVATYPLS